MWVSYHRVVMIRVKKGKKIELATKLLDFERYQAPNMLEDAERMLRGWRSVA